MRFLQFIALLLITLVARGQSDNPTPALGFLRLEPDARGSGQGLTGAATNPDNFSVFYNPAKIAMIPGQYGMSVGYVPYLSRLVKGVGMATAEGFRRMDENTALGLDIRFFSLGKVTFKDEAGYTLYSYAPTEWTIGLSYSRQLSSYSSIGFSLRYINSRPALGIEFRGAEVRAVSGVGADIGYYYCNVPYEEIAEYSGGILRGGITLQNLGTKVRYHTAGAAAFQPMNLRAGLAYTLPSESHEHIFTLSADINKLMVPPAAVRDAEGNIITGKDPDETNVPAAFFAGLGHMKSLGLGGGVEYSYNGQFFLRGGVYYESPDFSSRQLGTAGAGFNLGTFHLDISYFAGIGGQTGANVQAQTFKVSLGVNFDSQ